MNSLTILNEHLEKVLQTHTMCIKTPGSADVGDLVLWKGKFQKLVASGYEQGSGPRPSRCSLAFEGNPGIVEPDAYQQVVILKPNRGDSCPKS